MVHIDRPSIKPHPWKCQDMALFQSIAGEISVIETVKYTHDKTFILIIILLIFSHFKGALYSCMPLPTWWTLPAHPWLHTQQRFLRSQENPSDPGWCHTDAVQSHTRAPDCELWMNGRELQGERHRELIQPQHWLQQTVLWRSCCGCREALLCEWIQGMQKKPVKIIDLIRFPWNSIFSPNVFCSPILRNLTDQLRCNQGI